MESLLSFDVSAIDIVLLVAVTVLLLLFITQKRGQVTIETRLPIQDGDEILEESETTDQNVKEKRSTVHSPVGFQKCVHDFGYLKNLSKNTPVPDECFGCPKVMRCLFPNE